jgi:hypothetical protein
MAEKNPKELIKIVIIRSVLGKLTEEGKLTKLVVGKEVNMQRKLAEELISIRKAVIPDTPAHEAWLAHQENLAAAVKQAPKPTANERELTKKVAELEAQIAELTKPAKK